MESIFQRRPVLEVEGDIEIPWLWSFPSLS